MNLSKTRRSIDDVVEQGLESDGYVASPTVSIARQMMTAGIRYNQSLYEKQAMRPGETVEKGVYAAGFQDQEVGSIS